MTRQRGVPRKSDDIVEAGVLSTLYMSSITSFNIAYSRKTELLCVDPGGTILQATEVFDNGNRSIEWRRLTTLRDALAQYGGTVIYD